jgi:hypothetical protein
MRNTNLFLVLAAVALLVFALSSAHPLALAQQERDPAAPTAPTAQQPPDGMNQQLEVKTFTGKIMKSGEVLVLKNAANQSTYVLDDQDRAKSFEGRDVKVRGTQDPLTGIIHITSIELEPGS